VVWRSKTKLLLLLYQTGGNILVVYHLPPLPTPQIGKGKKMIWFAQTENYRIEVYSQTFPSGISGQNVRN